MKTVSGVGQVNNLNNSPLWFGTNNTEWMRIDNAGNIGIGTTTPNSKLDISGTIRATTLCDGTGANCKTISAGWTSGTVTSVLASTGLTGGTITSVGTVAVDVGTTANKILQVNVNGQIPVIDGFLLSNVNAVKLRGNNVLAATPIAGQYLGWNATTTQWEGMAVAGSSQWTTNGANIYYNTGNVGIGTTTPNALFEIGAAGSTLGVMRFAGSTSGYAALQPTAAAGNVTITMPATTGTVALTANKLSAFAATTSSELAGVISDETGSGALVFGTSPSLTTPTLGVASATTINKVTLTAPATGSTLTIADGKTLTASNTLTFTGTDGSSVAFGGGGTVMYTSNNLSAHAATTSAQLAGVISDETGSGALVFATSPSLTTPTLGVASATTINKVTLTAPATGSTLTIADGKTLTASNTLTFTGTDASSVAFGGGGTVMYTSNNLSAHAATTSAQLAGVISDETGSGALVFGTSPTFTTGITSPLHIGGTGTTSTLTLKTTTGVGTTNADMIFQVGNNGATEAMRILNSGNVGIGTTTPASRLDVFSTTAADTMRLMGVQNPQLTLKTNGGATMRNWGITSNTNFAGDFNIVQSSDNSALPTSPRLAILDGGNVGIGTTSPTDKLNIIGSASTRAIIDVNANTTTQGFQLNMSNGASYGLLEGFDGGSQAAADYHGPLAGYIVNVQAGSLNFGTSNTTRMMINSSGNVGIGITNPSYTLHVVGTAGLSTGTAWTNASDIRLKDVHGDYEYGLDEVLKLHTIRFNYKKNNVLGLPSDKMMTGFIAQEVQKVIPDAVKENDNGYLELNVDPIHWAVVNSIKQLYEKFEDGLHDIYQRITNHDQAIALLASENASLRSANVDLKKRIEALEKTSSEKQLNAIRNRLESENQKLKNYLCEKDPRASFCTR